MPTPSAPPRDALSTRVLPAGVFVLALLVRALYLLDLRDTPLVDLLLIDSETYDRLARLVRAGSLRGEEVYSMNPLYPYFLAAVYAVGDGARSWIYAAQAGLDAATCAMIVWLGVRLFGRGAGLLAGLGAALYGPLVFYTGTLLTPTLIVFLMTAVTVLFVRYQARPGWGWALAAGLALGLASLGRGNNLLLVPLALPFFRLWAGRWRGALRHGLVFATGALVVVGLVTVRNYRVEGRIVPVSANFAAFYIGHNPEATGLYAMPSFTAGAAFEDEVMGTREAISAQVGRPLTVAETSTELFRRGVAFARERPGAELRLALAKLYYFWNRTESPTNLSYHFAQDFSGVLRLLPLGFGVVAPLGLLGGWLSRRRWRELLVLYLLLAIPLITVLLFFMSAEYRMPAVPVLLLLAGHAVTLGWGALRDRRGSARGWLFALTALASLAVLCNVRDERLRFQSLKRVDYLNFGNLYKDRGDYENARIMLRRSLAIDPRYGLAYAALAEVEARMGNETEALRLAGEARRFRPEESGGGVGLVSGAADMQTLMLRAGELYRARQYPEALAAFRELAGREEAVRDPALRRSIENNLGLCRYQMGDLAGADSTFTAILAGDSTYVKAYNNLAKVRIAQGRVAEASALFRKALAVDPENRIAREELSKLPPGR